MFWPLMRMLSSTDMPYIPHPADSRIRVTSTRVTSLPPPPRVPEAPPQGPRAWLGVCGGPPTAATKHSAVLSGALRAR